MAKTATYNMLVATAEAATTRAVLQVLAKLGIRGTAINSMDLALKKAGACDWDVIMVDLELGQSGALKLLRQVKQDRPETPVLVVTQSGSVDQVVTLFR